jgi:succinoglycan biosynthesis transport protein ExoP
LRACSDILTFKVKNSAPLRAAKLATAYAHAFSDYRLQLATASFATAREDLEANLQRLRKKGLTETQLYRELEQRSQELRTLELLQTKPAVVREATDAAKVAPAPIRTASFGLAFGLLLGIAAAFLWNALDRRVRDESEVEAALGIPLLARLSSAHRSRGLVMLDKPSDIEAEAVRRLRAGLEFANLDLKAKVIMVGSAVAEEGKSVTLANLAVALARSGRSVALVDLDLRRPSIGRLFGIRSGYGLTDVALGRVALDNALVKIPLGVGRQQEAKLSFRTAHSDVGELFALESGEVPPNPSELIGTSVVRDIVTALRERMDYVLVDAPPVLAVSDASILSSLVDAIIVVVRLGRVNSSDLHELARELRGSPAPMLGFIITGSSPGDFYSGYEYAESSEVSNGARGVRRLASALPSLEAPDPKQVAEEREGRSWA